MITPWSRRTSCMRTASMARSAWSAGAAPESTAQLCEMESIRHSAQLAECRIDSISQSWAVLSGAAPALHAERAMDAVRMQLVRRDHGVIMLLAPPFDQSTLDPGYIKGYLPGVRENGGQYTHAALWV